MAQHSITEFEIWQPGYGGKTVTVLIAGTTAKAGLFTDEALTAAAANPQVLSANGANDGKFAVPIYTSDAYYLDITGEQTGTTRPPLTDLIGVDASTAKVLSVGGTQSRELEGIVGRVISVLDHGVFLETSDPSASSSTNTTTLSTAIGVAAARGGGDVVIPAGTYAFTSLTLSAAVRLRGQGRSVTTLQSQTADKVVTLGGDQAGFSGITLDGVDLQVGSVGVFAKAKDELRIDDVEVKRFVTGIHQKGGRRSNWRDLFIDSCTVGAKFHGDLDVGGGADGDEYRNNIWKGGKVTNCTTTGVEYSFVDKKAYHNSLVHVGFENNTGTAVNVNGARHTTLTECWWSANTTAFAVDDDADTDNAAINTVVGLTFDHGSLSGGAATLTGTCQDIMFRAMEISDVDFTLTLPNNNITVIDCVEDSLVTLSGLGERWTRARTMLSNSPGSTGITTDAIVTQAWSIELAPGQRGSIEAVVIGNQRNGEDYGIYHISRAVHRPGSALSYDAQTVNFTLGDVVTGAISGATARIIADADAGATGTLTLRDIVGTFVDGETITDAAGGSATVNGLIVDANAALLGATAVISAAVETDLAWAADFAANAGNIEIQVTGAALKTIEWVAHPKVTLS